MTHVQDPYVMPTNEGGWRVTGTRVSLDSVVYAFLEGLSPEEIVTQFPALTLEQAYGAIAFYLKNRNEIDRHLATKGQEWERLRAEQAQRSDPLLERIRRASAALGPCRNRGASVRQSLMHVEPQWPRLG